MLTLEEMDSEVDVHPDTIRRWLKAHNVPVVRFSDKVLRVKREVWDVFVEGRTAGAPEDIAPQ